MPWPRRAVSLLKRALPTKPRPGIPEPWSNYDASAATYASGSASRGSAIGWDERTDALARVQDHHHDEKLTRDSYNPYRDERRDERRGGGYGRERSRSPPRRDAFSPSQQQYGGQPHSPPPNDNSEVILIDIFAGRACNWTPR